MPRVLLILFVIAVAFWVVSVVDCAVQPGYRHRGLNKAAWIVIVVLLPVIGGLLWFLVGRGRRSRGSLGQVAPDDDPSFLGSIGAVADQDERIRRLEEELARLDAEADEPRPTERRDAPDGDGEDGRGPRRGARG